MALQQLLKELPLNARVLDVGCLGLEFYRRCKQLRPDVQQSGCDIITNQAIPNDLDFKAVDVQREPLPFPSDSFDLVVASHIIEHVNNPVGALLRRSLVTHLPEFFGELIRIARPGSLIYVEAPSDRAVWFSFPYLQNWHLILSYYDDPTHTGRPWTPQAFYRLALFYACRPILCRYDSSWVWRLLFLPIWIWAFLTRNSDLIVTAWWKAIGWACYIVLRKPNNISGKPPLEYRSWKGTPPSRWGE